MAASSACSSPGRGRAELPTLSTSKMPLERAYAASAITTTASTCIVAFLKSMLHAACASEDSQQSLSTSQRDAITASLACAAAAVAASAAFLAFKSRAKQGLELAAAICAQWQPACFLLVSVERIVLLAVMVANDAREHHAGSCGFALPQLGQVLATELLMAAALLLFSLCAICCDHDPDFTPAMRRGAYSAAVACLLLDLICSFVWGSIGAKTDQDKFSFGPFRFAVANQITSCIASQVTVLLHLLYVSCRSRGGRGWAYASLRFELVKKHDMGTLLVSTNEPVAQAPSSNAVSEGMQGGEVQAQARSNSCSRLRHRLLLLRRQRLQTSRVFSIPCVESECNLATALSASGLELVRPLFRIKFPNVIVRFVESHTNTYFCVLFIVALVSLDCSQLEPTDTATLVLNIIVIYGFLGFLSSKRYNIDSIAVKRVSSSFRFVCICALVLSYATLDVYLSYLRQRSPQAAAATIIMMVLFILCLLFDCSPNLPTTVQTAISVCACLASF